MDRLYQFHQPFSLILIHIRTEHLKMKRTTRDEHYILHKDTAQLAPNHAYRFD